MTRESHDRRTDQQQCDPLIKVPFLPIEVRNHNKKN